jgi:hypothetical protein
MVPKRRRYPFKRPRNFAYNKTTGGSVKKVEDIPLPNEVDAVRNEKKNTYGFSSKANKELSLTDFISKRFQIDEIILLGLIFLLLEERINDDYLLIILTYLLITGID